MNMVQSDQIVVSFLSTEQANDKYFMQQLHEDNVMIYCANNKFKINPEILSQTWWGIWILDEEYFENISMNVKLRLDSNIVLLNSNSLARVELKEAYQIKEERVIQSLGTFNSSHGKSVNSCYKIIDPHG